MFIESIKIILATLLFIIIGYAVIRVFSKAAFKSYFETKKEQNEITKEETNEQKRNA